MTTKLQSRLRGITLIQTATSVATIVGLITTIFIPALIGLRDRNRQAICATRIAQLTKAMLVYAQDYDETPPFMGIGWESIHYPDKPSTAPLASQSPSPPPPLLALPDRRAWAYAETWLTQNHQLLWNGTLPENEWQQNGVGLSTGLLFTYTRFETLYRCPEFERIPDKSQNAFNYTRTDLGRKWIMGDWAQSGKESDYWGGSDFGAPGPIMRTSEIHRPSWLPMIYDESALRHVGSAYEEHIPPRDAIASGGWAAVDCMHFLLADEIGSYHGRPIRNDRLPPEVDPLHVKCGYVGCYDGHVELTRTFWANMSGSNPLLLYTALADMLDWLSRHTFAQRGKLIVGGSL
ncbi:MAG: hypothetical protein JXQ73_33025 [Phycisphaerae bacterium]|nr:hypothetical protein [Phycisphaerae bacterium]